MKRILALLVSLIMIFALVACNNTEEPDKSGGGGGGSGGGGGGDPSSIVNDPSIRSPEDPHPQQRRHQGSKLRSPRSSARFP